MISSSGSRRYHGHPLFFPSLLPMSALFSMLIICLLLLGVIGIVSRVTLGE